MKLNLKKYKRPGRQLRKAPSVTVSERGFMFNAAAYRNFFSGVDYVELYWDGQNHVIGILPQKKETDFTFHVRAYRQESSPTVLVNARPFISDHKIMEILKEKKTFPIEESEGMLLVRLKN